LTTDHLGSPRVTTNERGVVVNRRDFMAFGEEAVSVQRVGGASGNGYEAAGSTRKDYTGYEKDMSNAEFGVQNAEWKDPIAIAPGSDRTHYNPTHGRFTSVDPLTASATIRNPQTLNRYSYALNSPYKFTDPLGLLSETATGACGGWCQNSDGGSGGWTSYYYSGQLNGPQQQMIKEFIGLFGQAAWDALVNGERQQKPQQSRQAPDISDPNELCNPFFEPPTAPAPPTLTVQIDVGQPEPVVEYDANGSPVNKWQSPVTLTLINDATGRPLPGFNYVRLDYSFLGIEPRLFADGGTALLEKIKVDGPNGMEKEDSEYRTRLGIVLDRGVEPVSIRVKFSAGNSIPSINVTPKQIALSP